MSLSNDTQAYLHYWESCVVSNTMKLSERERLSVSSLGNPAPLLEPPPSGDDGKPRPAAASDDLTKRAAVPRPDRVGTGAIVIHADKELVRRFNVRAAELGITRKAAGLVAIRAFLRFSVTGKNREKKAEEAS